MLRETRPTQISHTAAHTRRALGHTISDKLTRHQLNAAIERLSNTDRTVEEIAQACGFCSASHLGLRLKAVTGHTPGHYRQRLGW